MYEKKKLTNAKRLLSIVMSAALVFSTFQNTSLTSYALESEYSKEISKDIEDAESGSVCLKETDTEQESGVSEETDTEYESSASEEFVLAKENEMQILEDGTEEISANNEGQNDTYIGTISNEEGRQGLIIDAWEIQEAGLEFNNEEIINILRIRRDNNEKYNFVNVNYDSVTNLISKDVWNAAVEILESEENRSLRFNFAGDDSADENWYFEKPEAVMEDINTDTEFIINDTEQNATICFAKTDFNADFVNISFNLNSEKNGYDSFKSAFENISFFEIADSEGNIENVSAAYSYNNEESWATLDIWNVKKLSANMDYTIQQGVYRGHVDSWDESGYEVTCLNVISSEVNKDVLDTDEIISALESHEGESFDEIYIEASEGNTNTISKDVINTAAGLLKNTQERDKTRVCHF